MRVCATQNGHLITPIVRCVHDIPSRDPFTATPGTIPYHRFLQSNRAIEAQDRVDLSSACKDTSMPTPLLPNLGEVIEPTPPPKVATSETRVHQQLLPATGRVLDIYA